MKSLRQIPSEGRYRRRARYDRCVDSLSHGGRDVKPTLCLARTHCRVAKIANCKRIEHRTHVRQLLRIDSLNRAAIDYAVKITDVDDCNGSRHVEINDALLDHLGPGQITGIPIWVIVARRIRISRRQGHPTNRLRLERDECNQRG